VAYKRDLSALGVKIHWTISQLLKTCLIMHSFGEHGDNIACVYGRVKPSATITNQQIIGQSRKNVKQSSQSWPPTAAG
jgi:hypothetical protein